MVVEMDAAKLKPDDYAQKLQKEKQKLCTLQETLLKSKQLTNGMTNILTSFEGRLAKLEDTILPVYHETGNLQRRQENIEKTMSALDHVIGFYSVSREVETTIRDGPSGGLEVFLAAMARIQTAIDYFEKNNPNSPEIHSLMNLQETGREALQREFRSLLSRHSKAAPAVLIMDLINADDEFSQDEVFLEHLPEGVIKELIQLSQYLLDGGNEDFMNVYASIRSNILKNSLQGLKDHQRSLSGNGETLAGVGSPGQSVNRLNVNSTPTRKTSRIIQQILSKRSGANTKSSDQGSTFVLGHRRKGSHIEAKEEVEFVEEDFYIMSLTALYKLMQSELQLMEGIVPKVHQGEIFERIIQPSLDVILQEGENMATRAKKSVSKHDFSSALAVFPVLKHLLAMRQEFELLLHGVKAGLKGKYMNVAAVLHATGAKLLDDFLDNIKNDISKEMPSDGTVHELTSNVIMFLEQLQDYIETVGTILSKEPLYQQNLHSIPDCDKAKCAMSMYIVRVLSTLGMALFNKSESYSDPYLKAIFRLNNTHYILKSLQRTGLIEIAMIYSKNLDEQYNDQIMEHKRLYSQSWSRVLHYTMEVERPLPTHIPKDVKLKDKDRQNIKDKFTGFNKEIDDIYRIQKFYAIPDAELRESLKKDNKDFIVPKYTGFYEKYNRVNFTKNLEKYLRFTPQQVEILLNKFFDAAA